MKITLLSIAAAYLSLVGLLYFTQRSILYFPAPPYQHEFSKLRIDSGDERINVIVLNPNKPNAILYFGGNAEPVVFNAEPFTRHLSEYTIYLMEYRGYGESTGSPTEAGLFADAVALFDAISEQHQRISLIGRSLGSGVATYLATQRSIDKLALITPFDSIANVAKKRMPIFPVTLLLKDQYNSISRAPKITAEVFIAIAEQDNVVPKQHAYNLAAAFNPEQIETLLLRNADHNNISLQPEYFPALSRFLQ